MTFTTTTLSLVHEDIERAKDLRINISELCRVAIATEIARKSGYKNKVPIDVKE
jgi:post-segregation antitoxin (ccd killing protein)